MPASEPPSERHGGRLLTILFWSGMGLAPLALLLLLVGQSGGALRVAVALVLVAVVLIGLSIMLRRDGESMRLEMEETLLEEVEMLREDLRNDIATAARATHKAFSEKLQVLHESVQALRSPVDTARAGGAPMAPPRPPQIAPPPERPGLDRGGYPQPEPAAAPNGAPAHVGIGTVPPALPQSAPAQVGARARVPSGVVRHTETVQVTTRQTIVDQHGDDDAGRGRVYGGGAQGGGVYGGGVYGGGIDGGAVHSTVHSGSVHSGSVHSGFGGGGGSPAYAVSGVDEADGVGRRAERYGGDPGEWAAPAPPAPPAGRRRRAEPDEESWSDQRYGGDGRRPRPYERADDPGDDPRWTDVKAGDRWAAVRSDERGRELRIGERRAAVHASESGSEVRIEDRWAAVRREEPRREPEWRAGPVPDDRRGDWSGERHVDDSGGWLRDLRGRSDNGWERRGGPAALPPSEIEPTTSWGQSWSPPEREPAGRRRRYREEDDEYRYQSDNGGRRAWRGDEDRWR